MAQNVAELGIVVNASGAVTEVRKLGTELDRLAGQGDRVSQTTKQQDQELRKLAEISRSMGDIQGKQFQSLIKLNGGQERFLQIQKQIDEELRVAAVVEAQYAQTTEKATQAVTRKGLSVNALRSPLSTLSSQIIGLNPQISQLASVLGSLAVGSVVITGVLAGTAAVGIAYNKLTEDTRKAREEQDKFVASLARARAEELKGSPAGAATTVDDADRALTARRNELAAIRSRNVSLQTGLNPIGALFGGARSGGSDAQSKEELEAIDAVRQAEIELSRARVRASQEKLAADRAIQQALEGGEEVLKAVDERAKKRDEDAIRRLKERIDLLNKLNSFDASNVLGNIDARLGQNPLPDYLAGKTGGQTGVSKEEAQRQEDKARADLAWEKSQRDQALATDKTTKSISGLDRAAQVASQALEYTLVQKLGGGGSGANLGAAIAKGALQDYAGGFAKTALGSAIFTPIAAGLGAAVGSIVDKLDLFGNHAKEVAEAMRKLRIETDSNALSARTTAKGFSTKEDQIAQAEIDKRKRIADADKLSEPFKSLEKLKAIDDFMTTLDRINKQFAERDRSANEDLEVRRLRATGKDKEADRLDLINRQQAEIFAAQQQGMSEEYIARLKEIQALERSKEALDDLTKSALNLVQGYRYQDTIFDNAPIQRRSVPDVNPNFNPQRPSGPIPKNAVLDGDLIIPINIDGEKIGDVVLKDFRKRSQRKFGTTSRWSEIN